MSQILKVSAKAFDDALPLSVLDLWIEVAHSSYEAAELVPVPAGGELRLAVPVGYEVIMTADETRFDGVVYRLAMLPFAPEAYDAAVDAFDAGVEATLAAVSEDGGTDHG